MVGGREGEAISGVDGGGQLEKLVKVCFESSGGEWSIMEGIQFDKSREIPGIVPSFRLHQVKGFQYPIGQLLLQYFSSYILVELHTSRTSRRVPNVDGRCYKQLTQADRFSRQAAED